MHLVGCGLHAAVPSQEYTHKAHKAHKAPALTGPTVNGGRQVIQ